jgi:4-hydroxy-2-oxoheptanedioate aldolase
MRAEQGFDMVSVVTDLGGLEAGMMRQLEAAKGAGEGGKRDGY